MNLFDFGMEHDEPDVWDIIPDIEWEKSDYEGSLIWIYGTCWLSNLLEWFNTPDHMVII